MAATRPLKLIRRAIWPAMGLLVIGCFAASTIMGENGLMSLGEYREAKAAAQAQLDQARSEEARLAHRAQLMDPKKTDPDLAEEEVKRQFGVVRADEVVVPLR